MLGQPQVSAIWLPTAKVPLPAIQDYEKSVNKEIVTEAMSNYGQDVSVFYVKDSGPRSEPKAKKSKTERYSLEQAEGYDNYFQLSM